MAPCRVIEDSDEDEDGGSFGAPDPLSPSVAVKDVGAVATMQPTSTDPMLFRAVYEEHLGQLLVDEQLPSHGESPLFEDPIGYQRISSSASVLSARKLKRSKTINISSVSSITEPTLSNRKAKRTQSMGVDDLTQITSPRKSTDAPRRDPWEVPTSSASDRLLESYAKVTSRNAERKNTLKTYGRQIRRAQTAAHTARSTSTDRSWSSPPNDDMPQTMNQNMSAQDEEDDDLWVPRTKRQKRGLSMTVKSQDPVRTEQADTIEKEAFPLSSDNTSTSVRSMPIQEERSTSLHASQGTNKIAILNTDDFSSLPFKNQTNLDVTVENSYLSTKSSAVQVSERSFRSIIVMPNTLSVEQKLQYETVSVASTARSRQSSPSAIRGVIYSKTQYAGDSLLELPPVTCDDSAPVILLSSSPPVSAMNLKIKRSKSEVGLKRMPKSATTGHHNKVVKRKGRSKTIAQGEMPPCREAWVDELSLTSVEPARRPFRMEASTGTGEKRAYSEDEHEPSTTDGVHTLGETGLEEEQYRPRPSQRRAKSISAIRSKADIHLPRADVVGKKSKKPLDKQSGYISGIVQLSTDIPVQASIIRDGSAMATPFSGKDITEGNVRTNNNSMLDRIGDHHALAEKPSDVPVLETVLPVPTQPKKRDRKKTSEIVAAKINGVSKTQSDDSVPIVSEHSESHRKLHEMDGNKPHSQEIASTPPTKASAVIITAIPPPAQTPTKDLKNGPDQHSPLQSGKVPYRVGLSKKTRIAPLLKMIRK